MSPTAVSRQISDPSLSLSTQQIFTDTTWLTVVSDPPNGFTDPNYDDSSWSSAVFLGAYGVQPWNNAVSIPSNATNIPSASLLRSSNWIWTSEMSPNGQAPASARPFRKTVSTPSGKKAMYANISITTDNQFSLYVNGNFIGSSNNIDNSTYSSWQSAAFYPMVELESDVNVFAVASLNDAGVNLTTQENTLPSAAGVLAGITIALADEDADVGSASPIQSAVPSSQTTNVKSPSLSKPVLAGIISAAVIFSLLFAGFIALVCVRRRNGDQHFQRHRREKLGSLEMDNALNQGSSGVTIYDLYDPSTGIPEPFPSASATGSPTLSDVSDVPSRNGDRRSIMKPPRALASSSHDGLHKQSTSVIPSSRESLLTQLRLVARQEAEMVMREQRNEDSLPRYVSGVPRL